MLEYNVLRITSKRDEDAILSATTQRPFRPIVDISICNGGRA